MKKLFVIITLCLPLFSVAYAGEIECKGSYQGQKVSFNGKAPGILVYDATGSLIINSTEIAKFEAKDMSWDMFEKSFVFSSPHGDKVIGKFDNYMAGLVTVSKIEVPGRYSWSNIRMKCKTN